jgi:hypothetical protein
MRADELALWKVYSAGGQLVIHVPNGCGETLRAFLLSRGVSSLVSPAAAATYERLEIARGADAGTVQEMVDGWRQSVGETAGSA